MKRREQEGGGVFGRAMGVILFVLLAGMGCRTLPPLPPVDLSERGWTVQQGQAVWKSGNKMPEIAGELMLASRPYGNQFIQFTKTPFPLVIAQKVTNHWQINFPTENKRYSGLGAPPKRLIWFWLSQALSGKLPGDKWSWNQNENGWRLENHSSGERLEGYFANRP